MHLFLNIYVAVSFFSFGWSVKAGRRGEISGGVVVDYNTAKSYYPFMVRLVMDAALRCGGAVISNR
jgi:hypothetical protein